jgi:hypothetical protein
MRFQLSGGYRAQLGRWWARLKEVCRLEEFVLLGFLILGVLVAKSAGAGLNFSRGLNTYSMFLIKFAGYTFAIIKPLMLASERWGVGKQSRLIPLPARGEHSTHKMLRTEVELVRGGILLTATLTVYTNIKVRLPILASRLYDGAFLTADRWLLGEHMHRHLVEMVASSRLMTGILDLAYTQIHLPFVLLVACLWVYERAELLRVLLLAYSFNYILGILISVQLPSYGLFYFTPEHYAFLDHLTSGRYQWSLIRDFEQNRRLFESVGIVRTKPFSGITAFPSLHVAHMTLVTGVGWKFSRWLGAAFVVFSVVGTVATVALGWHYVVDGLAGCALGGFTMASAVWSVKRQSEFIDI